VFPKVLTLNSVSQTIFLFCVQAQLQATLCMMKGKVHVNFGNNLIMSFGYFV